VVSGRDLSSLLQLTRASHPLVLIGSHGAESSIADAEHSLSDDDTSRLRALVDDLSELVDRHPEARLEHKPSAVVLHTRGMPGDAARAVTTDGEQIAAEHDGVRTTPGKNVLEMSVTEAGKGASLLELADELGATAILYAATTSPTSAPSPS
jgi:trehalose-phosphatase